MDCEPKKIECFIDYCNVVVAQLQVTMTQLAYPPLVHTAHWGPELPLIQPFTHAAFTAGVELLDAVLDLSACLSIDHDQDGQAGTNTFFHDPVRT